MSFDFTENLTLYMPDVDEQVKSLAESATTAEGKKLIVELAAIHEGLTANYNMYKSDSLEKSLASWVQPYPKPIILNHDPEVDAIGRVMAARMDKEADGTPYIRLQIAVTDPASIQKVMDERYLTGSVGGRTESAICSICNKEWANASMFNLPCKHERGKVYNGKLAYLELGDINWKEYSFVNIPADQKSGLRSVSLNTPSEGDSDEDTNWVRPVQFYTVDMNKESIMELSESAEPKNILSDMKKKDAHVTYLNIKGTFLSVSAFNHQEENEKSIFIQKDTTINNEQDHDNDSAHITDETISEETNMSERSTAEVGEDILEVVETLSADLASTDEDDNSETVTDEVVEDATEAVEDEVETETEAAVESEEVSEDNEVEDAATTEGEEQLTDKDESIESPEEQAEHAEVSETPTDEAQSEESEEQDDEDPALAELSAEINSLREENVKLKKALHFTLAERVVDTKISAGLLESADRASALEDHASRTPSSLADALRDLEKITRKIGKNTGDTFEMNNKSMTSGEAGNSVIIGDEADEDTTSVESPEKTLEDLLVDTLMNRKKL